MLVTQNMCLHLLGALHSDKVLALPMTHVRLPITRQLVSAGSHMLLLLLPNAYALSLMLCRTMSPQTVASLHADHEGQCCP